MHTFTSVAAIPAEFGPSAVTIGKFDGVHAGHRAVLRRLLEIAGERGLSSAVVTFDRNPLSLLAPEKCPVPLLSNSQKLELLASIGVDATLMLEFDRALSALSPEQFAESILVGGLRATVVLIGADFRFGAKGAGDAETLRELGQRFGFEVLVVGDVAPNGQRRASSTWIREMLSEGRVVEAAELLGGAPTIRSVVVPGEQRGRQLGYPTANLSPQIEGYIPADGVYAARLTVDGTTYPAAVSIGNNPTFEGVPDKQVEAHVIDETLDLYGKTVELAFVEYIRGMRKFPDAASLAEQMGLDERWIRDILGV
ncbi:bifunctional riboflavin kinase/FAD synthetase [soil metagenome]